VMHEGHEFLVQTMEGRRVGRVRVTRAPLASA
jgi:hypothetical protein